MAEIPTVYLYNENGHRIRVNADDVERYTANGWSEKNSRGTACRAPTKTQPKLKAVGKDRQAGSLSLDFGSL